MERGYLKQMIGKMGKVKFDQRLKIENKQADVSVLFVITNQPKLKKILKKLDYLLCQDESVEQLFIGSYCKEKKLSSFFVLATLYPLED